MKTNYRKCIFHIMANDTKWLEREEEIPFAPYPGINFEGIAGDQPLKVSGMSYDLKDKIYKVRLAWLSQEPLNSQKMLELDVGWKVK